MADHDAGSSPSGDLRRALIDVLERLADIGARPEDSHDDRLREGTLILASVAIALVSFVWVGTYVAYGYPVSAAIPATYQVITAIGLLALSRTKRFDRFRTTQFVMFLLLPALLQASLGGFVASSGIVMWSTATPLAALALLGLRRSLPWLLALVVEILVLTLLDPRLAQDPDALPAGIVTAFFALNLFGVTFSSFLMLGYFVHQRELVHRALEAEQDRSERLLLNVLPAPIAERLKRHEGVIAEQHDHVTMLFADLVGFTARSAAMEAHELVTVLDRIFSAFDALADAEGLEKIKTIGDAYMVAGGIPDPRPDHAQAVARMALAIRDEIAAIAASTEHGWLDVRIGIDTGPAVAGVIGQRKFIYDLWGDTVNTASRMESPGVPGEIQVTARTAAVLGPGFVVSPRGTIEVKGKGPMETFLLDGVARR
ncbi:MAG: adenylate/guanylate cyclase domain-containing protein [Actinomycetota bacterium]